MRFAKRFLTTTAALTVILLASASCEQLGLTSEDSNDTELLVLLGLALGPSCSGTCKTFLTSSAYTRPTSLTAADEICASDSNKPSGGGAYKALLAHSTQRVPCTTTNCGGGVSENVSWILKPNTKYVQSDGTTEVFTTNSSGIFPFGTATNGFASVPNGFLTGLNSGWVVEHTCNNWTDTTSGSNFRFGSANATDQQLINFGFTGCNDNSAINLVCIEQ